MQPDANALTRALAAEGQALGDFVALLREEQQSLVHGELERLASFTEPKARHMLELTRLAEQRLALLRARQLPADRAGMDSLLREHAKNSPQALVLWQKVLALAAEAHHLNDLNGTLIATRLRGTQQALSALFSAARIPGAYAADGSTVPFHTAHKLAIV